MSCCMMVSLIVGPVVGYLSAVVDCPDGTVSNSGLNSQSMSQIFSIHIHTNSASFNEQGLALASCP